MSGTNGSPGDRGGGLDADNALYEARRCMSCGTCISCDNCVAVCPDDAVHSLGMPGM